MHNLDVLHRDLKPTNVMLDGRGRVRLTDFGLATTVDSEGPVEIAGTPAYMAPEQFAGQTLSVATDLYALGLVLWEIFTGERLQSGQSAAEIRRPSSCRRRSALPPDSSASRWRRTAGRW
jgi:serine/threonine-protein kinase